MYYSLLGTGITVFVGIFISYLTQSRDDAYDSTLIHPLFLRISRWFPGKPRYYTDIDSLQAKDPQTPTKEVHDNYAFEVQQELPPKAIRYNRKPSLLNGKIVSNSPQKDINEITVDVTNFNHENNSLAKTPTNYGTVNGITNDVNGISKGVNGISNGIKHNGKISEGTFENIPLEQPTEVYRPLDEHELRNNQ